MTNKNPRTYVLFVVDSSGSMNGTKEQALDNFNEQVQQMKLNAKEGQEIIASMVTFNASVYEHSWNEDVESLGEATYDEFKPSGGTALYDGIGYGIQKLHDTTDHEDEDNSYLVIIISDGGENSSKHYNTSAIKEFIQGCQDTGRWTFTYMGCNASMLNEVAKNTGIHLANMAMWDNRSEESTKGGLDLNSMKTQGYFRGRSKGVRSMKTFYSVDPGQVADYTTNENLSLAIEPQEEAKVQSNNVSAQAMGMGRSISESVEASYGSASQTQEGCEAVSVPEEKEDFSYERTKSKLPKYGEVSYKREKGASLFANSEKIEFQR